MSDLQWILWKCTTCQEEFETKNEIIEHLNTYDRPIECPKRLVDARVVVK